MSGLKSRVAVLAAGKSIWTDWSRIMFKLANINEARRKNMMSISGMISMRAFFSSSGEPILIRPHLPNLFLARGRRRNRKRHVLDSLAADQVQDPNNHAVRREGIQNVSFAIS